MNPITIRLLSQQLICQQFSSPADVVSHLWGSENKSVIYYGQETID